MTNKEQYLNYVHAVLDSIPKETIVEASYNTGYGIHLVSHDLGQEPMTLYVVNNSIAKVNPPDINNSQEWDEAWEQAKSLINTFVAKRLEERP